ncbi:hypothetical protein ACJ73_06797, partial [Blastomyces percursus]
MSVLLILNTILLILLTAGLPNCCDKWKSLIGRYHRWLTKDTNNLHVKSSEADKPSQQPRQEPEQRDAEEQERKRGKEDDILQVMKLLNFLQDLRIEPQKNTDLDSIFELFLLCDRKPLVHSFLSRYMSSKHSHSDSIAHRRSQSGKISVALPKIDTMEKTANTPSTTSSSQPAPDNMMSYQRLVMPMPIPGAPGAPYFDGKDVTAFADRFEAMCTLHFVTGRDMLAVLRNYCAMELQGHIDQLVPECKSWEEVKKQLLAEFWREDSHQQMYNQTYLHALSNKPHTTGQEILSYCRQFRAVAMPLIRKNEMQQPLACLWFLQGLPAGIREKAYKAAGFNKTNQSEWELPKVCDAVYETQKTNEEIARVLASDILPQSNSLAHPKPAASLPAVPRPTFNPPVNQVSAPTQTSSRPAPDVKAQSAKDNVLESLVNQMGALSLAVARIQNQRDQPPQNVTAPKVLFTRCQDPALDLPNVSYYGTQRAPGGPPRSRSGSFVQYNRPPMTCWGCGEANHVLPNCIPIGQLIDQGKIHRNMHGEYYEGNVARRGPKINVNRYEPHIVTIERFLKQLAEPAKVPSTSELRNDGSILVDANGNPLPSVNAISICDIGFDSGPEESDDDYLGIEEMEETARVMAATAPTDKDKDRM